VPSYGITTLLNQNGTYSTNLCLPSAQSNVVNCTVSYTTTQVSVSPPYAMIQVQCVWTLPNYGGTFTNTVAVLRAPNAQ
jgi:membrane-associated PAP2 superfamily phosphatase